MADDGSRGGPKGQNLAYLKGGDRGRDGKSLNALGHAKGKKVVGHNSKQIKPPYNHDHLHTTEEGIMGPHIATGSKTDLPPYNQEPM